MTFVGPKILFLNVFSFKEMCIELLISGNESLICRRLEDTDEDARSQAVISVVIKTYCRLWHTNITTFLCQIDMMKTCHTQFFTFTVHVGVRLYIKFIS